MVIGFLAKGHEQPPAQLPLVSELLLWRSPEARWRADGKEIYFVSPDGKMMAAAVHTNGAAVEVAKATPLFGTHVVNNTTLIAKQQYAVSRDGRFLIIEPAEGSVTPPITLILNWKP